MTTEHIIETSLTLDYRNSRWGLERIVLDAVSNHLPDDSKGTTVTVKLKQEGNFYEIHEADKTKPVEQIVIEDNGVGYDFRLLSVLFSTKAADALSVGQFGEGLKMVAAASLRENVGITYQSRNWCAVPCSKAVQIDNKQISQLYFKVEENEESIAGSRTIINFPRKKLIEEVFQIPQKVLALNKEYEVLYQTNPQTQIIDLKEPVKISTETEEEIDAERGYRYGEYSVNKTLFIKGVKVDRINALYDYNLGINDITPDRIYVQQDLILQAVHDILTKCTNTDIIKAVLTEAHTTPNSSKYEVQAFQRYAGPIGFEDQNDPYTKTFRENRTPIENLEAILGPAEEELLDSNKIITITNIINPKKIEEITTLLKGFDLSTFFNDATIPQKNTTPTTEIPSYKLPFVDPSLRFGLITPQKYPHWAQAFKDLYGEKAVIASEENDLLNKEVETRGYTPIKLHKGVANFLSQQGIKQAKNIIDPSKQDYHWVSLEQLTQQEQTTLKRTEKIHQKLGIEQPIEVRIYEGLYDWQGEEVKSELGMYQAGNFVTDKTPYIGIKRSELATKQQFDPIYIAQLGHYVTGKKEKYDRDYTEFFVKTLADKLREKP